MKSPFRRIMMVFSAGLILSLLTKCGFQKSDEVPDLILINGTIITVDSNDNIVEAIAIKGDKIMATGTTAKIQELGMFTFVRWNFIFICPPLTITKDQVDEGLEIISRAISIADRECH